MDKVGREIQLTSLKEKIKPFAIESAIETSVNISFLKNIAKDDRLDEAFLREDDEPVSCIC
jgi:hypothetical protein